MKILTTLITTTIAVFSLTACKSLPSYSSDYSQADQKIKGIPFNDAQAHDIGSRFVAAFNTLGTSNFVTQASSLYADQLYINDTLSQFSNKQELIKHFKGMNNRVSNVSVKLISATHHQDSAYIHWYMAYDFKMFGRTKTMASYGISEIKINSNQKIIFQQDYWDPANGLYRSLPVFGGAYKWVLPFKKS
ncbi:MAG: nuclear transport factor 2 family protein [Acinetobacter tandoii]|uniref:nuclear transport factor 2 family protein n=1 Tax=Acinetobacter tandoii TaxID=202954 RepID=UPI003D6BE583